MMIDARRLAQTAVEAVSIDSETSFSWFGQAMHQLPERVEKEMTALTARAYLAYALQSHLYDNFYCRGRAIPSPDVGLGPMVPRLSPFVLGLSSSNCGSGTLEPGWRVCAIEKESVVVERHGLTLWVPLDATYPRVKRTVRAGQLVSVSFPKELLQLSPGFYMALGDRWLQVDNHTSVIRFYWHLRSEGAGVLVDAVTRTLNRAHLPFRLKVVNVPERYTRCDAGVLYARKRDFTALGVLLRAIYVRVAQYLEPATPAFTKPLAPGLALAEDPGNVESFGMSRCRLLAEGLIRAHEQSMHGLSERMSQVDRCFQEAGIRLVAPFLNPGSRDRYVFQLE